MKNAQKTEWEIIENVEKKTGDCRKSKRVLC